MSGSVGGKAQNVDVVRALWAALRERSPEDVEALLDDDVAWIPALLSDQPLHGRRAVRTQVERITESADFADSQPFSFEPVGEDSVLVSGALRLRRPDGSLATHLRWWVYRLRDGRIVHAANHESREGALAAARARERR